MTTLIAVQETTTSKQQIRAGSGGVLFGVRLLPVLEQIIQSQVVDTVEKTLNDYPAQSGTTRLQRIYKYKEISGWATMGSLTFLGGEIFLSLPYEPGLAIFFSVASTYLVFWMKARDAR